MPRDADKQPNHRRESGEQSATTAKHPGFTRSASSGQALHSDDKPDHAQDFNDAGRDVAGDHALVGGRPSLKAGHFKQKCELQGRERHQQKSGRDHNRRQSMMEGLMGVLPGDEESSVCLFPCGLTDPGKDITDHDKRYDLALDRMEISRPSRGRRG